MIRKRGEKGQALIMVLVLLLFASIIITSTLGLVAVSRNTNTVYKNNTTAVYAAEAGIQDAIWNLEYQPSSALETMLTPTNTNDNYTPYDYTSIWTYTMTNPVNNNGNQINNNSVTPTIKNTWIPLGIPQPTLPQANAVANDPNLTVTGHVSNVLNNGNGGVYEVDVNYNGATSLAVTSIGVWLPQGFTYSGPVTSPNTPLNLPGTPQTEACAGNEAVVWSLPGSTFSGLLASTHQGNVTGIEITNGGNGYNSAPTVTITGGGGTGATATAAISSNQVTGITVTNGGSGYTSAPTITFTGGGGTGAAAAATIASTLTFNFEYQSTSPGVIPECLSWINNSDIAGCSCTWDANVTVYDIKSTAGNTTIETYVPQAQARALGHAMNGDYVAIGNSLMDMGPGETTSNDSSGVRYNLLTDDPYTENIIPFDANVEGAYLYWGGWFQNSDETIGSSYGGLVNFSINGHQVCFNNGSPAEGSSPLTPDKIQTTPTNWENQDFPGNYYYSCYKDVTSLVRYELGKENTSSTYSNLPGGTAANPVTYDIGQLTTCPLGDTGQQPSWAGWSLIIVYSSPGTLGHQIYIYDTLTPCTNDNSNNGNQPYEYQSGSSAYQYPPASPGGYHGGVIVENPSGFLVPNTQNQVGTIDITNGGSGYTSDPTVTISEGGGIGVTAAAAVSGGSVAVINITSGGSGYTSAPTVSISGGGGTGATATATIDDTAATLTAFVGEGDFSLAGDFIAFNPPLQYQSPSGFPWSLPDSNPSKLFDGNKLYSTDPQVSLTNGGSGYTSTPSVTISGGGGSGAKATATISTVGQVTGIAVTANGSGYTSAPTVTITGGGGSGAAATATIFQINCPLDSNSPPANNTAAQPDNVWNSSYSPTETFPDGVDIKNFSVPWASNLLQPGATTAQIDMPTFTDGWCLLYMVVSFRSSVTSGGSVSYLINK